ncbi:MAG TPA: SMI1/KNR4 family protein [Roseiflexaceae bacterium]|nr:SMI1/KNR4 family protein [Roseiflexaceae bacterium]
MDVQSWERLMRQWSQDMIEDDDFVSELVPDSVIATQWLGYPKATEAQIAAAEQRLGVQLPPSYRTFLQVTNGWRQIHCYIHRMWSTEEIEWFAVRNQAWIDIYLKYYAASPPISDQDYFVYGEQQYAPQFRPQYLSSALEISEVDDGTVYLLNPQVVTPDGEWEAWLFANWLPGAHRYRSFWEMMQSEHQNFLNTR